MKSKKILGLFVVLLLVSNFFADLSQYAYAEENKTDIQSLEFSWTNKTLLKYNYYAAYDDFKEAKPTFKVYKQNADGSTTNLVKNRDYTYFYTDNTRLGTAKLTIQGTGDYTGTKVVEFEIKKKEEKISESEVLKEKVIVINGLIVCEKIGHVGNGATFYNPFGFRGDISKWKWEGQSKKDAEELKKTLNDVTRIIDDDVKDGNTFTFASSNKKVFTIKDNKKIVLKHAGVAELLITVNNNKNNVLKVKVFYFPTVNAKTEKPNGYSVKAKRKGKYIYFKCNTKGFIDDGTGILKAEVDLKNYKDKDSRYWDKIRRINMNFSNTTFKVKISKIKKKFILYGLDLNYDIKEEYKTLSGKYAYATPNFFEFWDKNTERRVEITEKKIKKMKNNKWYKLKKGKDEKKNIIYTV